MEPLEPRLLLSADLVGTDPPALLGAFSYGQAIPVSLNQDDQWSQNTDCSLILMYLASADGTNPPQTDAGDGILAIDTEGANPSGRPVTSAEGAVVYASTAPQLPGLELIDPRITNWHGQIVYLDFDGEQNVTYRGPVTVGPFDIPAFHVPGDLAGREQAIVTEVLSHLEQTFAGTGIIFTTQRPTDGTAYSTVYIGDDDAAFSEYGSFPGLAEGVDVGNAARGDDAIVFSREVTQREIDLADLASYLGGIITHEVGHLLGYRHVVGQSLDAGHHVRGPLDPVAYHQGDAGLWGFGNSFVHQYLTREAYDFYTGQFGPSELAGYIGPVDDADHGHRYVTEGSCDEDRPNFLAGEPEDSPWGNALGHYWSHDADFNRVYDGGWNGQDSAVNRAYKYFSGGIGLTGIYDEGWGKNAVEGQGIAYKYSIGIKKTAYYWLGHAAHLLEDMTLPAHAHADAHGTDDSKNPFDDYETYTAEYSNWTSYRRGDNDPNWMQWGYPAQIPGQEAPTGDIRSGVEIPRFSDEIVNPLYSLFYETASLADDYDSDDADGQVDQGNRRGGASGLSESESKEIGDTMMPLAIKAVAELFRYFYSVVDAQSPPVVTVSGFSNDESNPSPKSSLFDATASAEDSVSGVDQDGYHFVTWQWDGSSWGVGQDWGPCDGVKSIGPLPDGLYRIEASAENGAGDTGYSGYYYFYVDQTLPSGGYGMTITSSTMSRSTATPGQKVTLSGTGGQVRGTSDNDVIKVVVGLRDSSGHWVGGEPVVISSTMPGESWQPWSGNSATINAPFDLGTYHVWVRAVPTLSDATAIQNFKNATAADDHQRDDKWDQPVTVADQASRRMWPDLQPTAVDSSVWQSVEPGTAVDWTVTVRNNGPGPQWADWTVEWYLSSDKKYQNTDTLIGSETYSDDLAAGAGVSKTYHAPVPVVTTAGQKYLIARVVNGGPDRSVKNDIRVNKDADWFGAVDPDADEANDSLETAVDLGSFTGTLARQNLTIDSAEDVDWYKFTMPRAGISKGKVQIDFGNAEGDLALALYRSDGVLIQQVDRTGRAEVIKLKGLAAGTYYLKVLSLHGDASRNYRLTLIL